MATQWWLVILPLIALFINVSTQVIAIHYSSRFWLSILMGLTLGVAASLVIQTSVAPASTLEDTFINLLTYLTLSFCYFAFLNLNLTSLRIRVARELLKSDYGLNTEILLERYSPHELILRRLKRLEQSGQISKTNGNWSLKSKKLFIFIWVSSLLRWLIIPAKFNPSMQKEDVHVA